VVFARVFREHRDAGPEIESQSRRGLGESEGTEGGREGGPPTQIRAHFKTKVYMLEFILHSSYVHPKYLSSPLVSHYP